MTQFVFLVFLMTQINDAICISVLKARKWKKFVSYLLGD